MIPTFRLRPHFQVLPRQTVGLYLGPGLFLATVLLPTPAAIVYSSGFVKIWDMFRVGMVSDLARLAALILSGPLLAGLID